MDFFLKIKNWQLFLIVLIIPWILGLALKNIFNGEYAFMTVFTIIYYLIFIIWNYSVIYFFNKSENILTRRQIRILQILIINVFVYVIFLALRFQIISTGSLIINLVFFLLQLISVFAIFYLVFCSAKTIKYLKLGDQLRASDIIIEIFVILYFPIGVWWFQSEVNKYYKNKA
jgi:hypothetical protein